MPEGPFSVYQSEIYLRGIQDVPVPLDTESAVEITTDLLALEESVRQRLEPGPFWYVAGSAGSGATARANREAFDHWRIVPRMLRGATRRDLTTTVLGTAMPAPVLLAPIGVQAILHPDGELASARAAAAVGLTNVVSTAASYAIEEVAGVSDGPRWFQLYRPGDDDFCASILRRARNAGATVLVVTLDTWTLGWRPHDLDRAYLPFLRGEGTATPFSDPVFRAGLAEAPERDLAAAVRRWTAMFMGVDARWDQLPFLRRHWDGPIVLKGVQHVEDARRAVAAGVDGIVVSNHGGRQVDGAIASLDALPPIVAAVGDRIEVLFDSGIRTGADVFKALALGARAVLVGRPYAFGLAHGGEAGVRHVLRSLLADFDLTVALTGHRSVDEIAPESLRPRPEAPAAGVPARQSARPVRPPA